MDTPVFRIKHVGINAASKEEAAKILPLLCGAFSLAPERETDSHIFAGSLFEVMKGNGPGERGHIALETPDIPAAIAYFASKGIGIRENSAVKNADGEITLVYLDLEIGGFAFHLAK